MTAGRTITCGRLWVVAALAALVCLAAPAQMASAHAGLESSEPAAGSSTATSPAAITLTFAEDPDPALSLVRLLDADGKTVPACLP